MAIRKQWPKAPWKPWMYHLFRKTRVAKNGMGNFVYPGGAGIQAATTIAATGAEAVVTGHCGPKAFRVLETAGSWMTSVFSQRL